MLRNKFIIIEQKKINRRGVNQRGQTDGSFKACLGDGLGVGGGFAQILGCSLFKAKLTFKYYTYT